MRPPTIVLVLLAVLAVLLSIKPHEAASRILTEEHSKVMWLKKENNNNLSLSSLRKGKSRPPAPNTPTFTPGRPPAEEKSKAISALTQKSFAGHTMQEEQKEENLVSQSLAKGQGRPPAPNPPTNDPPTPPAA